MAARHVPCNDQLLVIPDGCVRLNGLLKIFTIRIKCQIDHFIISLIIKWLSPGKQVQYNISIEKDLSYEYF